MRNLIFVSMACLCLLPSVASAASRVSETQVRNVCGGDLQSSGGAIGCSKKCGNTTCDYNCYKDKCHVVVFRARGPEMRPQMDMNSMASNSGDSAPVTDGPALP